jgi:hypothetical protein
MMLSPLLAAGMPGMVGQYAPLTSVEAQRVL